MSKLIGDDEVTVDPNEQTRISVFRLPRVDAATVEVKRSAHSEASQPTTSVAPAQRTTERSAGKGDESAASGWEVDGGGSGT